MDQCDNSKKLSEYNKKLKSTNIPNGDIPLFHREDGSQMTPHETIDKVTCDLFPGCIDEDEYSEKEKARDKANKAKSKVDINDPRASFITVESVKTAFKTFGRFKGSGSDNFKPLVLQNMGYNTLLRIVAIYRACYLLSCVPKKWLDVKIVYLTKPNKTDLQKSNAFRPISLMQFFWKGLEKLLQYHNKFTCDKPTRNYKQHGFREKYSTETALTVATEIIEHTLINHNFALVTCLDLTNCFGTLPFKPVVDTMKAIGCKPEFIEILKDFMENRRMTIDYKGVKIVKYCTIGQGQGSCISPWAFSIVADQLLEAIDEVPNLKGATLYLNAFCDDLAVFSCGTDLVDIFALMQTALNKCMDWAHKNGLKFEPSKSNTCLHTRRHKYDIGAHQVTLYDHPLKMVETYRYLGITFDKQLNFNTHIDNKIGEAKRTISQIWSHFSKLNGIKPKFCLLLWKTCIRPKLTYGCFLWSKVTRWKVYVNKLNYIQRYALSTMGWFRKNMAGAVLETVTNCLPLPLYVDACSIMSFIRSRGHEVFQPAEMQTKQPKLLGHRLYISNRMEELGLNEYSLKETELDNIPKVYHFNKSFKVDAYSFDKNNNMQGVPQRDTDLVLYSDGSYKGFGRCGSGLSVWKVKKDDVNPNQRFQIPIYNESRHLEENTVFLGEIDGIRAAAGYIINNHHKANFDYRSACLYVDSQAALLAVDNPVITSNWVAEAVGLLEVAARLLKGNLTLRWCKAHVKRTPGYAGPDGYTDTWDPNDQADRNARRGAEGHPDTLVEVTDLPGKSIATVKNIVYKRIYKEWKYNYIHWEESKLGISKMSHFRLFWPEIDATKSNKIMDFIGESRKDFSIFVQLLSGADYLNKYQFKLGENDHDFCDQCGDETKFENFAHIIECPAFIEQRQNNFTSFPFIKEPWCLPVKEVACYLRELDSIIGFLPNE